VGGYDQPERIRVGGTVRASRCPSGPTSCAAPRSVCPRTRSSLPARCDPKSSVTCRTCDR
jgi:hypothetical protein